MPQGRTSSATNDSSPTTVGTVAGLPISEHLAPNAQCTRITLTGLTRMDGARGVAIPPEQNNLD